MLYSYSTNVLGGDSLSTTKMFPWYLDSLGTFPVNMEKD